MGSTEGLIDPSTFHPTSAQLKRGAREADGLVRVAGGALQALGGRVVGHVYAVSDRWAGLGQVYQAPESERVLGLVGPALAQAEEVLGALTVVRIALGIYADALWRIAGDLAALEAEAQAFRTSDHVVHGVSKSLGDRAQTAAVGALWGMAGAVVAGYQQTHSTKPWHEDGGLVAQNRGYWDRLYACQQQIESAAMVCATMISQSAAPQVLPQLATLGVDSTDQIAQYDADQGWGSARGLTPGAAGQVWNSLNHNVVGPVAALAFGWDTTSVDAMSRTAFAGQGPEADKAREQVFSGAWIGLGDVVVSAGVVQVVGVDASSASSGQQVWGRLLDGQFGDGWTDARRKVASDTAVSMLGGDPSRSGEEFHTWRDTPLEAATTTAITVASLVAGPKGLGAAGRAGLAAEDGARAAGVAGLAAEDGARVAGVAGLAGEGEAASGALRAGDLAGSGGLRAVADAGVLRAGAVGDLEGMAPRSVFVPRVFDDATLAADAQVRQGMKSWLYGQDPLAEPSAAERVAGAQVGHPEGEPALVGAQASPVARAGTQVDRPADLGPGRTTSNDAPTSGYTVGGGGEGGSGGSWSPAESAGTGRGGGLPQDPAPRLPDGPSGSRAPDQGGTNGPGASGSSPLWDGPSGVRTQSQVEALNSGQVERGPTYADYQQALERAPVDEFGNPVDHRDGSPLRPEPQAGRRLGIMQWDSSTQQWVLENRGDAFHAGYLGDDPWTQADVLPGESSRYEVAGTADHPVPDQMTDLVSARSDALAQFRSTDYDTQLRAGVDDLNTTLADAHQRLYDQQFAQLAPGQEPPPFEPYRPLTEDDFHGTGKLKSTIEELNDTYRGDYDAIDAINDAEKIGKARIQAFQDVSGKGEAFGEAFGEWVREQDGGTPVYDGRGRGTFDQVYLSEDRTVLVINECKAPTSPLGHITLPGGSKPFQGSAAYLDRVLRNDTALQDAIKADPDLVEGLKNGTITVRYQEVRPFEDGTGGTVTEFDTSRLDTPSIFNDVFRKG